ncbi:unnamed protein product [marine sediment metagenome]|uniref:Uncharacterized protein n=1 Tax=marine sediment metagenome TaxID=412755 RepID=X1NPT2_9ZZZZ
MDLALSLEEIVQPFDIPDIGANGNSDIEAGYIYYHRLGAGLEISLLIEYAGIGQQTLSVDFRHTAVLQYGGGIITIALIALGKADYYGFVRAIGGELLDG